MPQPQPDPTLTIISTLCTRAILLGSETDPRVAELLTCQAEVDQALRLTKILTAALVATVQGNIKERLRLKLGAGTDLILDSMQRQVAMAESQLCQRQVPAQRQVGPNTAGSNPPTIGELASGYQPANTDKARLDRAKIQAAASQAVARNGAARQAMESGAANNKPMSEAMQVHCAVRRVGKYSKVSRNNL